MHLTEEQRCLLWLSAAKITPAHVTMLAEAYGGVQGVWDAYGSPGGPEFPSQARKALSPLHSRAAMDSLIDRLEQKNVRLLFQGDEHYPSRLAKLDGAPYLLYYAGSLDCLERPMVALVGTRQPSAYGREMARMLTRGLCEARWRREAIPSACWAAASTCPIRLNTGPSCGESQEESV